MVNKEVRDILLGRIVRQDEEFLAAAPSDGKLRLLRVWDGADDVRLFGVKHLTRNYWVTEMDSAEGLAAAEAALNSMGSPVKLASVPQAKACLYAPVWIAPVLLTVVPDEDELQITAYTGRSLLVSWFRCRIALWLLERRLPENIIYTNEDTKGNKEAEKQKTSKQTGKKKKKADSK